MTKKTYKVVNFVDVNELLSFVKKEFKELEQNIKEEERVEKELLQFINSIEKHSGHIIHHIGHEKKEGVHLVKFLFKNGGFLEVFLNKPLTINGHFISHNAAQKFAHGLKKALHHSLPESSIKAMYLDSVKVEDGFKEELLTLSKWTMMHLITIHKTMVATIIAVFIFLVIELTKEFFKETARDVLRFHSLFVSILLAIFIALFFEKIRDKIEDIVEKFFNK